MNTVKRQDPEVERLNEDAAEAEEKYGADELERFAAEYWKRRNMSVAVEKNSRTE